MKLLNHLLAIQMHTLPLSLRGGDRR